MILILLGTAPVLWAVDSDLVLVLLPLERERVREQWAWAAWLGASLDFWIGSLAWRVAPNLPRTLALRRWATLLPRANAILGIIVVAAVQLARGV